MYPARPDAMEKMYTDGYLMLSRNTYVHQMITKRKAQLVNTGSDVMAKRADILHLFDALAEPSVYFIRDCIRWMDKYRLLAARVLYDVGNPVSDMYMTMEMDTYRTEFGSMNYGWTETILPAIENGTIVHSVNLLDQMRNIVIETHNAHSNLRRILAAMLRKSCYFRGFGIENVDRIMALPHAAHEIDLEEFRKSVLRISEDGPIIG